MIIIAIKKEQMKETSNEMGSNSGRKKNTFRRGNKMINIYSNVGQTTKIITHPKNLIIKLYWIFRCYWQFGSDAPTHTHTLISARYYRLVSWNCYSSLCGNPRDKKNQKSNYRVRFTQNCWIEYTQKNT